MKSEILNLLEHEKVNLTKEVYFHLKALFDGFAKVSSLNNLPLEEIKSLLNQYLFLIKEEIKAPCSFGIYHEQETKPFDFYSFGVNFFSHFLDKQKSIIKGKNHINTIVDLLNKGENVILLSNHQTEIDPTLLAILLEDQYPNLIKNITAVAGARVTSDPVATPFTRGQNVLCVYSKRYFEMHPEEKQKMQQHNSSAMLHLRHLLNLGSKLIYIAPSGGRDRKDKDGKLYPAEFNPDSIELMRIVGQKAEKKTHYFPLALYTYPVMPPPEKIKKEIGEERILCHCPIHIAFGEKVELAVPLLEDKRDKEGFKARQSLSIYNIVTSLYKSIEPKD